jgi:hypothetical protein
MDFMEQTNLSKPIKSQPKTPTVISISDANEFSQDERQTLQ